MILKITLFVVAGLLLLILIKRNAPSFALLFEITLVAITLLTVIPEIEKMLSVFDGLQGISSLSEASLKIMLKSFGILSVGAVVADICRDNGESAVAGVVDLSVKILAISCCLPVFSAVIEIASTFINR